MKLISVTPTQIEADPNGGWRVVTRSPSSGHLLKVWPKCSGKPLKEAELLSEGINLSIRAKSASSHFLAAKR